MMMYICTYQLLIDAQQGNEITHEVHVATDNLDNIDEAFAEKTGIEPDKLAWIGARAKYERINKYGK